MPEVTIPAPSDRRPAVPAGQATQVEQSRAIAEVQAAVVVAQQSRRDVSAAVAAMRESCRQPALAARAFFRYSRAGSQITGPSIHLARELARVWGNIQYGITELDRDDREGRSEMQAYAWDLESNTRSTAVFVVPHARDTKTGRKDLVELRDIYENNANQGARRVREAIFAVLPSWFTEEAKVLCLQTVETGGDKPLAQRISDAVAWYASAGVRLGQLEDKLGRERAAWEALDVAQLEIVARSLRTGEATVAEEFPAARADASTFMPPAPAAPAAADDAGAGKAPAAEPRQSPPGEDAPVQEPAPAPASTDELRDPDAWPNKLTESTRKRMFAVFNKHGIKDRDEQVKGIQGVIGHKIASRNDVTEDEAQAVIRSVEAWYAQHPEAEPQP